MQDFLVRLATPNDLEGLRVLYEELRPKDPPLIGPDIHALLTRLCEDQGIRLLVGEASGRLVSTCMLAIVQNLANGGRPFGLIEHVVTLSAYRKSGFGREVLSYALAQAWEANCYKVMLLSGAKLNAAHSVYESLGFNGNVERGFVAKAPR